jgi:hypothetical protein
MLRSTLNERAFPMSDASSILRRGPFYRLQQAIGLIDADNPRAMRRAVAFALVSWLPLVILAGVQGFALHHILERSVLKDFSTHARFLVAVPLLISGEAAADRRFLVMTDYFIASGIVADQERQRYEGIISDARRLRDSRVITLFLVLASYATSAIAMFYVVRFQPMSWLVTGAAGERTLSWAGWWEVAVSLPLFQFLVYSSLWAWFIWLIYLWRLSRLRLRLTPTHPDKAGGLYILGDLSNAMAIFVFAIGSVVASVWAEQIVYYGASVLDFHRLFIAYLLLSMLFAFGPLLVFIPKLNSLRTDGLRAYGALASRNAQLFNEKWIKSAVAGKSILGVQDVSSLADLNISYDVVNEMRFCPIGWRSIAMITAAALIPMLPLILMEFPLAEILKAFAGIVF